MLLVSWFIYLSLDLWQNNIQSLWWVFCSLRLNYSWSPRNNCSWQLQLHRQAGSKIQPGSLARIHQVRNSMWRFMNPCRGGMNFPLTKLHRASFTSSDQLFILICHLGTWMFDFKLFLCLLNYVFDYCYFDILLSVITESVILDLWSHLNLKKWL